MTEIEPAPQTEYARFLALLNALFWSAIAASFAVGLFSEAELDRLIIGCFATGVFIFVMMVFNRTNKDKFGRGLW